MPDLRDQVAAAMLAGAERETPPTALDASYFFTDIAIPLVIDAIVQKIEREQDGDLLRHPQSPDYVQLVEAEFRRIDPSPADKTPAAVAEGAMNRLCAYDAIDAPADYETTADRVGEFMREFVILAADRLATVARKEVESG